jgi:hypothetical protein
MFERMIQRILRRRLNAFAKSVICDAKQRGMISGHQLHEVAGIIDRRLWPERHREGAGERDEATR